MTRFAWFPVMLGLVGCAQQEPAHSGQSSELLNGPSPRVTFNALTGNALTGNALTGNALTGNALTGNALTGNALTGNALTGNALTGNALTGNALTGNGVTNGQQAREVLRYIYSCAMPAGKRLTLTLDGKEYTFDGAIGLAPEWETGKCDHTCQRWISACVLARTNAFGVPVPISIRGAHPALANVTQEELDLFPLREGTYYGNIFGGNPYGEGRQACIGPASNEPALTARLCSNGGTEGGQISPCKINVQDECVIPTAELASDPLFGAPQDRCNGFGPAGEVRTCVIGSFTDEDRLADEVLTVFLKSPEPVCGNGVCEAGETHATCGDCSLGWAKQIPDPLFVDPTAGVAVDLRNDELIVGGMYTGTPDFGSGALPAGGSFLARYTRDGDHVWSTSIGTGPIKPRVIEVDSSNGTIVVAGIFTGTVDVGGRQFTSPGSEGAGFAAKFSSTGTPLWSVMLPLLVDRLALDPRTKDLVVGGTLLAGPGYVRVSTASGAMFGSTVARSSVPGDRVLGLAVDGAGQILLSTGGHGLELFDTNDLIRWTKPKISGDVVIDDQPFNGTAGLRSVFVAGRDSVEAFRYTDADATRAWTVPMVHGNIGVSLVRSLDGDRQAIPRIARGGDGNLVVGGNFTFRFAVGQFAFTTTSSTIFEKGFLVRLSPFGGVISAQQLSTPVSSTVGGIDVDRFGAIALAGRFQGHVIVDGFALTSKRQSFHASSSEMFLASVRDQIVNLQPNDRAGGAITMPTRGDGLFVQFFPDLEMNSAVGSALDARVNFSQNEGGLPESITGKPYAMRWSGVVESDATESVTFTALATDGIRVFLDEQPVIDAWAATDGLVGTHTGTFTMNAKQRYRIRVDYFNQSGNNGFARLEWQSTPKAPTVPPTPAAQDRELVPTSALTSEAIRSFSGTTLGLTDDYRASCGEGAPGPDAVYKFRLEEPTRVKLSAVGIGYDAVLHIRDGSTTAGEVACNDARGEATLDVTLGAGTYLVIVDGRAAGETGPYRIHAEFQEPGQGSNDATAIYVSDTNNGGRFHGSTVGAVDERAGGCGGSGAPDVVYRLVVTSPRQLHVDTNGSDFDTVVHVRQGTLERGCNDDFDGTKQSSLDVTLTAGTYFVYVDGKNGQEGTFRADFHLSPANLPPVASAGDDQQTVCLAPTAQVDVTLDGSGSTDPNGDPMTFAWSEGGVEIASGEVANVSLGVGSHAVTLDVGDGKLSATDEVVIDLRADIGNPSVAALPNLAVTSSSATGAVVTYSTPTASDDCDATLDVTCVPASGTKFAPGSTTVTCSATDDAGNTGASTHTIRVTFSATTLLAPVNADGSSVFKRNSTIPLKFMLTGASAGITDLVARVSVSKVSNQVIGDEIEVVSSSVATAGNTFRYDTVFGQYIFNLGTKGMSVGTYQIRIDLGDGVSRTVLVSIN